MLNKIKGKNISIDTGREPLVFLHKDSNLVKEQGFISLNRIRIFNDKKFVYATLCLVEDEILIRKDEIGFSKKIQQKLNYTSDEMFEVEHMENLTSFNHIRQKLRGEKFTENGLLEVMKDVVDGKYTDMHMSCLCSATEGSQLDDDEISYLAKGMINTGTKVKWEQKIVVDKHCIGGIPGNRTTPPAIAIIAEYGMTIPKTSSRAITSPSGTADTMEVLTNVNIPTAKMKDIVKEVNGCLIWGGGVDLNPSDDIIINVKKDLNFDSKGQMLSSILSKKVAAGSTHVLIDVPYGPSAKTKTLESANIIKQDFEKLGKKLGIYVHVNISDGSQPIGNGIGPALEAKDVVDILQNKPNAPQDLKNKIIYLSGIIIEFDSKVKKGEGSKIAKDILESGRAWDRFQKICRAQGEIKKIPIAKFSHDILAKKDGIIIEFENKELSNLARLAGCPGKKAAGVYLYKHLGEKIKQNEKLYTIYADSKGELESAIKFSEKIEIIKIK